MDPPRRPLDALLDLVLPTPCAGCGDVAVRFCARCDRRFARPRRRAVDGLPPVLVLAPYAGPARATVLAYKERGRRDLARPLAARLATGLAADGVRPPWVLVPAPSRAPAARARGGDHMVRLARAVPAERRVVRALVLGRRARDSVGLDAAARAANLARHLRTRPAGLRALAAADADGAGSVVLVDDVLTTGATARACVARLAAAGIPVARVAVLTAVRGGR